MLYQYCHNLPHGVCFVQTSDDPVVNGIFKKKIVTDKKRKELPSFSAEEGMKMVKKGGFALHIDTATAYKIIEVIIHSILFDSGTSNIFEYFFIL